MNRFPETCRGTLCATVLLLGGCMHANQSNFMHHYTLEQSMPVVEAGQHPTQRQRHTLQITRIVVPPWLDGTAMHYRLDYRNDRRIAAYAHSDWIAPPAALLETIVQNAIASGTDWRAVIGPHNPAAADASLHLRLDDFIQAFARPDASASVIDVTASLIDNRDASVVAQRHFHVAVAAKSADAAGGVKALAAASREIAADLQSWLAGAAKAGTPPIPSR